MKIVKDKLFTPVHGDAADGIAAIQIQQLHEAALHRQPHAAGRCDTGGRQGQQAGAGRAVGSGQGIQQVGGVVVLAEHAAQTGQGVGDIGTLVHLIGAGGAYVHLLHQIEVRRLRLQKSTDLREVGSQAFLAPRTGFGAAVHEEAVIVLVGAEADVIGHGGVGRAGPKGGGRRFGVDGGQGHIADAVVVDEHIGHIARRQHHQRQYDAQKGLEPFFHIYAPPLVYIFRSV